MSLPSWERGLKFADMIAAVSWFIVAPFVGAWIEIMKERNDIMAEGSLPSWERGLK